MTEERKGFYFELLELLEQDPEKRFYADNGKDLLRNKVYECAMKMDKDLIKLLLSNDKMKEKFFTDIDGTLVFDKTAFGWAINNKAFLQDSYTRFKNTIGLIDSKEQFISSKNDVVLSFPYKDCVLEGGQTKEDQKRGEIFYNELLAPDDVDRLLAPKVFTNMKRYTKDGEESITEFDDKDNLLIKGNNLLALSSILKRYEGRVKCIYIDPPYNTGSDSFNYNDNFNHSSWLVFMRNRIIQAYNLLSKEGGLFVQIDYHELGYLIPLLDEIFGKNNLVQIISVKTASPAGFKTVNPGPIDVTEYILFYAKDRNCFDFKKMYVPTSYDSNYDLYIENPDDNPENWKLEKLYNVIYKMNGIELGSTWQQAAKNAQAKWGDYWKIIRDSLIAEFALQNANRVVSIRDPQKPTQELKALMERSKTERDKVFVYNKSDGEEQGYVINGGALSFYSKKVKNIDGTLTSTELLTDLWQDISWDGIAKEGGVQLKNGKKPEKLLRRIIELATKESDIVLDFHVGSGTTCAVAHKLNRQYIGIEQLNYNDNDSLVRLINVLSGEQGGISKSVNWHGGGSFVYCELKELNHKYIDEIQVADDNKLNDLYKEITDSEFISYKADINKLKESEQNFKELSTEDKRSFLIQVLDKNLLYVNYCDMEDEDLAVTEEEKAFARSFYGEGV